MSKKSLKRCAGVLIAFLALMPLVMGIVLHYKYEKTLSLVSRSMKVNLRIIKYETGWLYSDAIIAANLPLADKPLADDNLNQTNTLLIKQRIYHGPFIFYRDQTGWKSKLALAYIDSSFDDRHHFAQTTLSLKASSLTTLTLNQYSLRNNQGIVYSIQGLQGYIQSNYRGTTFNTSIKVHQLLANVGHSRSINNFSVIEQLSQDKSGLWTGKKIYQFENFVMKKDDKQLQLIKFNTTINSQPFNNRISTSLQSTVAAAIVNNKNYGPQQVMLNFSNLDKEELRLVDQFLPMANSKAPSGDIPHLQAHLNALLTKGANLQINSLILNTAWGKVDFKVDLCCPQLQGSYDLSTILSTARGSIKGQFPIELANTLLTDYFVNQQANTEQANKKKDEILAYLQKNEWLIPSGNDFIIDLHWQNQITFKNPKTKQ